jgi:hypothetical protein
MAMSDQNRIGKSMTSVGFEPTPMKTTALTLRLRPLGQKVLVALIRTPTKSESHPPLRCPDVVFPLVANRSLITT